MQPPAGSKPVMKAASGRRGSCYRTLPRSLHCAARRGSRRCGPTGDRSRPTVLHRWNTPPVADRRSYRSCPRRPRSPNRARDTTAPTPDPTARPRICRCAAALPARRCRPGPLPPRVVPVAAQDASVRGGTDSGADSKDRPRVASGGDLSRNDLGQARSRDVENLEAGKGAHHQEVSRPREALGSTSDPEHLSRR